MNLPSNISPYRGDCYAQSRRVVFSAENDWPRILGAAQTLSTSPDWTDTQIARRVREAYSLHLQGKLAVMARQNDETSARIAMRHLRRWPEIALGAVCFVGIWWIVISGVMV